MEKNLKVLDLVGIDEAGRGALAGPLVVGAVKLLKSVKGLDDSKKLTAFKRGGLEGEIKQNSKYLVLFYSNVLIDQIGLSACLKNALFIIQRHFTNCEFIFDGNCNYGLSGIKTLIKADLKVCEVMAASILAKVARDRFMVFKSEEFDFASHKGYGTKAHLEEITRLGKSSLHRQSFTIKAVNSKLF